MEIINNSKGKKLWEHLYKNGGNSGRGACNHYGIYKAEIINNFIRQHNLKNIIDFGCGDGNQTSLINIDNYTGIDISDYIIDKTKNKYINDISKQFFTYKELYNITPKPIYDLSISLCVLYHLIDDNIYYNYLNDLYTFSNKYIIIYATDYNDPNIHNKNNGSSTFHRNFTRDIEKLYPNLELIQYIPQKYTINENKPNYTNFYIYKKKL